MKQLLFGLFILSGLANASELDGHWIEDNASLKGIVSTVLIHIDSSNNEMSTYLLYKGRYSTTIQSVSIDLANFEGGFEINPLTNVYDHPNKRPCVGLYLYSPLSVTLNNNEQITIPVFGQSDQSQKYKRVTDDEFYKILNSSKKRCEDHRF